MAMNKYHHIGLLTKAKDFLKSANKLNDGPQSLAAPFSVYYLYFHCIELALKSFIYFHTESEDDLKKIRHDLEKAWSKALEIGISELFPDYKELVECIEIANPVYRGKEMEYFYPGLKRLPVILHVCNASNQLCQALDRHYRAELKETRNNALQADV